MTEQAVGPARRGPVVAAGFVVIAAAIAAPQFVLPPALLGSVLVGGSILGIGVAMVARYRRPSRTFLVLLAPLVFLGIATLPVATPLSRPSLLVGIAAFAVAGALTVHRLTSR